MSDEQKSKVETIEDAFEKTLADMMSARDELDVASKTAPSLDAEPSVESIPEPVELEPLPVPFLASNPSVPSSPHPDPLQPPSPSPSMMGPPPGPPMGGPPGPPMMGPPPGPPMGGPPGPPMMGAPPGPPMGGPPGPPMMGPPPGPPMGGPPGPPMMGPPPTPPMEIALSPEIPPVIPEEAPPAPVVADLSALVGDSLEQEETIVEESASESEPQPLNPEFIPVDADDFMSGFEDEWDESAPVRVSDIDDTEDMDW